MAYDSFNFDYTYEYIDYVLDKIKDLEFQDSDKIKQSYRSKKNIQPDRMMIHQLKVLFNCLYHENKIDILDYYNYKRLKNWNEI
jgi:hypothetical protein